MSRSLAHVQWEILHDKFRGENSWCNAMIYKTSTFKLWRIRCSWFEHRSMNSTLYKVDAHGKSSFFEVKIPGTFNDNWDKAIQNFDPLAMNTVFSEICRLSDEGYTIALHKSEICKKKEIVEVIKPFEGSSLQIEADMKAPDFAYLDKQEILPF